MPDYGLIELITADYDYEQDPAAWRIIATGLNTVTLEPFTVETNTVDAADIPADLEAAAIADSLTFEIA